MQDSGSIPRNSIPAEFGNKVLRLGVSSCLLGNKVRFDGGHKRSSFLTDVLSPHVEWIPICPEMELGLGTPRPAMHLLETKPKKTKRLSDGIELVEVKSGINHTKEMQHYSLKTTRALNPLDLSGYVFKKDSPSCGDYRVKVYGTAPPKRVGRGLFAQTVMNAYPNLPVEEEGRLNDLKLRENFIERIFAFHRLKMRFQSRWTRSHVVKFHTIHKLQLSVHHPSLYRELGQLVASIKEHPRRSFQYKYSQTFMQALEKLPSVGRNTDALHHAAGHLKKILDVDSRKELSLAILDYKRGVLPLIVPVTLLKHHIRRNNIELLKNQTFLEPHPKELVLRNHS